MTAGRIGVAECPLCGGVVRHVAGDDTHCAACDRSFVGGFYAERSVPNPPQCSGSPDVGVPAPATWVPAPAEDGSGAGTAFPLPDGATALWIGQPETLRRRLPASDDLLPTFVAKAQAHVPPPYVLSLLDARVWGPEAAVIDRADRVVADVSNRAFGREPAEHPAFSHEWLAPPKHVSGRVAVVAARGGGRNYAHWMFDVLPRLDTVRRSGLGGRGDQLLVNSTCLRFHRETLDALGVPAKSLLESDTLPHLHADEILVPSLARRGDTVPSRTCSFLRESFLPLAANHVDAPRRLFVSRSDARWRRLLNEDEVGQALTARGFVTVSGLGTLPLAEHVGLFARAEAIVCAYGAGMVNTVFCRPEAVVVELLSEAFPDPHFWTVNERVGTQYRYVIGPPGRRDGPADGMQADFEVVVDQLLDELTAAGIR